MLKRALDDTYTVEVRDRIGLLIAARTSANACFRYTPPFLATIASGLDVSFKTIGVALAISELSGLLSPVTGTVAERFHRRAVMTAGLVGIGIGAAAAATSQNVAMFAVALVILTQSKVLFDVGLAAWVSDRVPYERRGRVIGLTETSWALGLLVGVSTMGLIAAATNWRMGFAAGAVAVVTFAGVVYRRVADDPAGHHAQRAATTRGHITRRALILFVGVFCLMGASQMLFVTFGKWLDDSFGFSDGDIALVVFLLGFGELFSSLAAARLSDRLGKERAGAIGVAILVPAAVVIAVGNETLLVAIPALMVSVAAFEFAVVSIIPLGTVAIAHAPTFGMSLMFAFGTLGRAIASIVATRGYEHGGIAWPATMAAVLALFTIGSLVWLRRLNVHQ